MATTVKKVKEGMFLISWNVFQIGSLSVDIKQIFANHTCILTYKILKNQTGFILWLEIRDDSSRLLVYPDDIKTITVTRNGVEKQMKKKLCSSNKTPNVTRSLWKSSWKEAKLSKCFSCKHWTTPTSAMFEIAIELESFSEKMTRTNKRLKSVHEAVKQIRENQALADVKFICQTETITGHSTILSIGSPVLAAMFRHDFQEKQDMVVEITDITANVFKQLLHYLYIQDADLDNFEDVAGLLVAADKYNVDSLKEECEIYLSKNLAVDNFALCLELAHLHKTPNLLKSSLDFISINAKEVCFREQDWMQITKNYPELAWQVIKRMAED